MYIGTHDIQNVSITPVSHGISITGHYIESSSAVGVLAIAYSTTGENEIQYKFASRPNDQSKPVTILRGLSIGDYQVSLFVVDEGGLPFNRSANLPSNVSVSEGMEYVCTWPSLLQ